MNAKQTTRLADINTAIAAFMAANAAIPDTATDDVMDAAVEAACQARDAVIALFPNSHEAVDAKRAFAATLEELGGWGDTPARIRSECEADTLHLDLYGVRRAA